MNKRRSNSRYSMTTSTDYPVEHKLELTRSEIETLAKQAMKKKLPKNLRHYSESTALGVVLFLQEVVQHLKLQYQMDLPFSLEEHDNDKEKNEEAD